MIVFFFCFNTNIDIIWLIHYNIMILYKYYSTDIIYSMQSVWRRIIIIIIHVGDDDFGQISILVYGGDRVDSYSAEFFHNC